MFDTFPIHAPLGPINMRANETVLGQTSPGALVDLLNFDFIQGALVTRPGFVAYSGVLVPSKPVMTARTYHTPAGALLLLVACGTTIWKESGGPGVFVALKTGVTDSALWDDIVMAGLNVWVDGVSADAFKTDGTTVYPWKITAPTAAPSVAISGAGVLTGNRQYRVTFVSKWGAETNAGQASAPLALSANSVALSTIPIGGADVAARRIYCTPTDSDVFFFLGEIPDNTTTVFTDNTSDADLSTDPLPIDHDEPPNAEILWVWKEYVWAVDPAKPTRAYHSHQGFPEIFNLDDFEGFYVEAGRNDNQRMIGIRDGQNALYLFKENSTWPVFGDIPDDFRIPPTPINATIGLYHRSIAPLGDGSMVGLHRSGVYVFNGQVFVSLSDTPDQSIQKVIDGLNPARLKWARGAYDSDTKRYILDVTESGFSYNNKRLVFDFIERRWAIYDIKANGTVRWNGVLLFPSAQNDGYVHKIGGLSDNGAAISVVAEWPWWGLWDPDTLKYLDALLIATTQEGKYEPIVEVMFDNRSRTYRLRLPEGKDWGSGAWALQGGTYQVSQSLPIKRKDVVSLKARIRHLGLNEPVTIRSLSVFGEASGRRVA